MKIRVWFLLIGTETDNYHPPKQGTCPNSGSIRTLNREFSFSAFFHGTFIILAATRGRAI
jgi:hypothetical protein